MKIISNTNIVAENQITTLVVNKYEKGAIEGSLEYDCVVLEQPLQIRVIWIESEVTNNKVLSITMRTPGNDKDLIVGLLFSERVITSLADIIELNCEPDEINLWEVRLSKNVIPKIASLEKYQLSYSGCGLCGSTSLKSLELKNPPMLSKDEYWLNSNLVYQLPAVMSEHQKIHKKTGGVHAAAYFNKEGKFLEIHEDVGRHNSVDKLIGSLLHNNDAMPKNSILVVSSRASFEIVQKTVLTGIPVLIAIGAPTDLAISAAKRFDLTLIGFTSNASFNLYHGAKRLQ